MNSTLKNKVSLIGRVGVKPQEEVFDSGAKKSRIVIATNEGYRNKNGEWVDNTQWHNVIAWGPLAERVTKQLDKGFEIIIEGRLVNNVINGKNGEKRYFTDIAMSNFMVLNKKQEGAVVSPVKTK